MSRVEEIEQAINQLPPDDFRRPARWIQERDNQHRELAVKNHRLWRTDPHHPSLRFKRLKNSSDRF